MLRLLVGIPAFLLSFVWSLFFPKKPRLIPVPPPPVPGPDAPSMESQEEGHEVSDAKPAVVAWLVGGLFAIIFGSMAALGWMYSHLYTKAEAMPVRSAQESFRHAPDAKTSIAKDWETIDALTKQHLDGYSWVDRARGVVQVPITRAMELIAKDGLPARSQQTPAFPPPDQEKLPLMQLESTTDATKFDPQ